MTMAAIAAVAAVLSYFDGLFVVRLAGNHDWRAFLYPLLPDGLIVICLIALLAAKRRPAWATLGLVLGIGLTLAMNVGAGVAHSLLDAVVDGFVPVVFFVAVEVFVGYVRRGRDGSHEIATPAVPATSVSTVPSSSFEAAKARLRFAREHDFKISDNELSGSFSLTRAQATKVRKEALGEETPNGSAGEEDAGEVRARPEARRGNRQGHRGREAPGRAGQAQRQVTYGPPAAVPGLGPPAAAGDERGRGVEGAPVPATQNVPAGDPPDSPSAPAGAHLNGGRAHA